MADTDLQVRRLLRTLESLGCTVEFTSKNYIKAWRRLPDGQLRTWMQHCHRGIGDTIGWLTVKAARRKLLLRESDGTPDHNFYSIK